MAAQRHATLATNYYAIRRLATPVTHTAPKILITYAERCRRHYAAFRRYNAYDEREPANEKSHAAAMSLYAFIE